MKDLLEFDGNEYKTYPNLLDTTKAVLKAKFMALHLFIVTKIGDILVA